MGPSFRWDDIVGGEMLVRASYHHTSCEHLAIGWRRPPIDATMPVGLIG